MRVTHDLKIRPVYYADALGEVKRFEVRENDRNYRVHDLVNLREWTPGHGYSGRFIGAQITYLLNDPQFCKEGFVIFGFEILFSGVA